MSLPLFPVTTVGSWPRPPELLRAFSLRHRRELGLREFDQVADRAVLASLRAQEHAGADLVTDGEQRRDNFYSFVAEKLDGVQMMTLSEMLDVVEDKQGFARLLATLDVPAFSIRNPTCVGRIQRREPLAVDDFEFLRRHTDRPIKITLPGPYLLTRAMWVKEVSRAFYPSKEDLGEDVVRLLRDEILELKKAGVAFIQLDEPVLTELVFTQGNTRTFMCAALAARKDPAEELAFAVSLINRVIEPIVDQGIRCSSDGGAMRTSNVERPIVGLHVCRGNWSQDEATLLRGSYHPLASYFAQMNVDQLVLEYATPRAGDFVPVDGKSIGLGVVNPRDPRIESAQSVVDRASAVLQHVAPDKLFLNPDCGFATFTSRAMNSAEVAAGKIAAMAEAAAVLRAEGTGQRAQGTGHRAAPAPAPEPSRTGPLPFAFCPVPCCVTSPVTPPPYTGFMDRPQSDDIQELTENEWVTFPGGELEGARPKVMCPACRLRAFRASAPQGRDSNRVPSPRLRSLARATARQAEPRVPICFQCFRVDQARARALRAARNLHTASEARFQDTLPFEPVNRARLERLRAERSVARAGLKAGSGRFADRRRHAQIAARHALDRIAAGLQSRDAREPAIADAIHAAELQLPDAWIPFVVSR